MLVLLEFGPGWMYMERTTDQAKGSGNCCTPPKGHGSPGDSERFQDGNLYICLGLAKSPNEPKQTEFGPAKPTSAL